MKKMNFFGVGPKIAVVLLPWLAISIIISSIFKGTFTFSHNAAHSLLIIGIILMVSGLAFYFSTVKMLLKGLNETKLMTKGAFSLCQNPLYSSIVLFIIPALSFMLNSWLVLTTSLVGYIMFKIHIRHEYQELEKLFGKEYVEYKANTPEFFPLPLKRWLKKK